MQKIFKEIHSGADGILSAKRIYGAIGFLSVIVFAWVKMEVNLMEQILYVSVSLLGLETIGNMVNRKPKQPEQNNITNG